MTEPQFDCRHRGKVLHVIPAGGDCCSHDELEVYACTIHRLAVIRPYHDGVHVEGICKFCPQREPTDG